MSLLPALATAFGPGASMAETCVQTYQRLIPEYESAARLAPGSAERMDAFIQIENRIFTALESCPDHPRLLSLLTESEIAIGRFVFAEHYARRIVKIAPGYWRGHSILGWILVHTDKTDEGIRELEQAAAMVPDNGVVRLTLCQAYVDAGRRDEARRNCTEAARSGDERVTAPARELLIKLGP